MHIINIILTWTDFSRTIISNNGLFDLNKLEAKCQKNKVIRGFSIDKPSPSTIRWALHCISPSNLQQGSIPISKSTAYQDCLDNRLIWLDRHIIKCDNSQVLHSFYFEKNPINNKCRFLFKCVKLQNPLCHQTFDVSTITIQTKHGDISTLKNLPIISYQKDAGINGFQFSMFYPQNSDWETLVYYGWCITTNPKNQTKLIGIDIEVYFNLNDGKMLSFLTDFYDYYRRIEKYVSFMPHYLFDTIEDINSLENEYIQQNCVSQGKYCYNANDGKGRYYILESLRHLCIYQSSHIQTYRKNIKGLFWDFILVYKDKCKAETAFRSNCGVEIFEKYGVHTYDTIQCLCKSFGVDDAAFRDEIAENDNKILLRESVIFKEKGILEKNTPLIVIDNQQYIMNLNARELFEEICLRLIKALDYFVIPCANYYHQRKNMGMLFKIIIVIICIFIIVLLGIMYYKSKEKKLEEDKRKKYIQMTQK